MQGLGIAAFTIAIIAIFTPVFGFLLSSLSGLMAMFCYRSDSKYAVGAVVLNLVNLFLLSPMLFIGAIADLADSSLDPLFDKLGGSPNIAGIFFFLVSIQLVAIALFVWAKHKRKKPKAEPVKERIEPTLD